MNIMGKHSRDVKSDATYVILLALFYFIVQYRQFAIFCGKNLFSVNFALQMKA